MIHALKTESEYFQDIVKGNKSFETRSKDRNFMVGDFLAINEFIPHECNAKNKQYYTGRCCLVEVVYVLTDERFVKAGFAILGIRPCWIGKHTEDPRIPGVSNLYKTQDYGATISEEE